MTDLDTGATVVAGPGRRARRRWPLVAVGIVAVVVVACTTPPAPVPTDPLPPAVSRFSAVVKRTEAPVTAVLVWTISDPNRDPLVCRVDTDGDGTFDRTVDPCTSGDLLLLGPLGAGTTTFALEVDDGITTPATATTTLTVTPGPSEPFDITLQLAPDMPAEFAQAFTDAADRWEQVIVAGWAAQPLNIIDGFLGWVPGFNGSVDDVMIAARDTVIDGPGQVLGSAGALLYRDTGQPFFGVMQFDTADLERLDESGRLGDVILHEMGHILGIGGNWILEGRIDDLLVNPSYNGTAGKAAWQELGGSGSVPLENEGGLGTAFAHWRETTFGNELMTGYSDGDERLSRLTVAALSDRGFGVDLDAADPYLLPTLAAARSGHDHDDVGHTDPIPPYPGESLPAG